MPLPSGTPKLTNDLITQADTTWKDNGGSSLTKTRGSVVRQFFADLLASFWSRLDTYVLYRQGIPATNITFQQEAIHRTNVATITVDGLNGKHGTVVRLYYTGTTAPSFIFLNLFSRLQENPTLPFVAGKTNIYSFLFIQRGSGRIVDISHEAKEEILI